MIRVAALLLLVAPAMAPGRTPATDYVLARAADGAGDLPRAAAGYAAAMAAAPGDRLLAMRAYRQAVAAGEGRRALAAARTLEAAGMLPSDGRLLLIGEAARARDWSAARAAIARVPADDPFGFLLPVLSAWVALGEGGDPLAALVPGRGGAVALPYLAEHRALLLIALGRQDEGIAALRALGAGSRTVRLKLAAAAALDPRRQPERDRALALLAGDDPALVRARATVAAGRRLPAAVLTPAEGIAELYVRVAADLNRERITPVALAFARMASLLAPGNAGTWLAVAALAGTAGQTDAALAALTRVPADDPLQPAARDQRLRLLVMARRTPEALAEAQAAADAADALPADWTRVGDLQAELGRRSDAAQAYARAIALAERDPAAADGLWSLWLLRGGALEQAGDWAAARPALERAVALGPERPAALNYLGYALLEHGESLDLAQRLIERAARLAPEDGAIADSLGWAYYRRGRLADAIVALERAAAGEPADSAINEHLGDAYWTAGRRVEARYAWRAASVYAEPAERLRLVRKIDDGPAERR